MNITYPAELPIEPLTKPVNATVTVPGSKSITNRALVLAALVADHTDCTVTNMLESEDTEVMQRALCALGFDLFGEPLFNAVRVRRYFNRPIETSIVPAKSADLFLANSGTSIRFLTALVSAGHGRYRLDGIPRMRERPIEDLLVALRQLGVNAYSELGTGCPPVIVETTGLNGGTVNIRADVSSQFLSGLLMVAPFAKGPVTISSEGTVVSEPYIEMTIRMMRSFGLSVDCQEPGVFKTTPYASEEPLRQYAIEPDASAASYFWAAAAVTGGRVTVGGLNRKSLQGDVRFVDVLQQMGCRVEECDAGITVHGKPLRGVDVDMNDISDTVMTLGAVACFAEGPTTIRSVAHIRHKETDRIAALATELRKLGAKVEERDDGLTITPRPLTGCAVDTYNDHRMAMSLALIGLKVPGVVIRNPGCVAKTYPGFWQDFEELRQAP